MISNFHLKTLVFAIPALLVAIVVALLGYGISHSVGDTLGATGFTYASLVLLLIVAGTALLLLLALGVRQVGADENV